MKSFAAFWSFIFFIVSNVIFGQDVKIWKQFNGRYDFVFIGNTLNPTENNTDENCTINTSSSANLNLDPSDKIIKSFLYWAGSGGGDFEIQLNGNVFNAARTFAMTKNFQPNNFDLNYFSAVAEITDLVKSTGNGNYLFSGMDLNETINSAPYCQNRTNFGGWAMIVIYENDNLPLNQLNIYDGLQGIPTAVDIALANLNVIDNLGAKIGFVAWEGDRALNVNETLRINGNILSNGLNPPDNAFNGTNTFSGSSQLYNMDLDVYDIQNNIKVGDTKAMIQLTSGQDFVMINAIVTNMNSQLPDATVSIDNVTLECNSKKIDATYTVYNLNSTHSLPANVPVAIYSDGIFVQITHTLGAIPIGESQTNTVTIDIPSSVPNQFTLHFKVDSDQIGNSTVPETDETNNEFSTRVNLLVSPAFNAPPNLESCNQGFEKGIFDFSDYDQKIKINPDDSVSYFETYANATANINPINNAFNYATTKTSTEIFVRIESPEHCVSYTSFFLILKNCKPIVYNLVDPTSDGGNSVLQIDGLYNVFLNFKLEIYNRWGTLVWTGIHNIENWDGSCNVGLCVGGHNLPAGTYFYVLNLNDPAYKDGLSGYIHLNR